MKKLINRSEDFVRESLEGMLLAYSDLIKVNFELTDSPLQSGDSVLAFVNSMAAALLAELYVIYRKLALIWEARGLKIVRSLVGPYTTSLEMQGASITLLKLDEEMVSLWDAPVHTGALRWGI